MSDSLWGNTSTEFFYELTPELVLHSMDQLGFKTNGRLMTLNSMENRVYDLEIDNHEEYEIPNTFIVTKFYRPGRWSVDQITDEHQFLFDLQEADIPVIAPLRINGKSVFTDPKTNLHFCVFPKMGGRAPDELTLVDANRLGSLLARVHNIGATKTAEHRLTFTAENFIKKNAQMILAENIMPLHLEKKYQALTEELFSIINESIKDLPLFRIHGDCHMGNIIQRHDTFTMLDFDDFVTGPAIQDLWLLAPRNDQEGLQIREQLLDGYLQFRDINPSDFNLLECMRTMRLIHYQAWLTKRRNDPTFQHHFGDIEAESRWERHLHDLQEQRELLTQSKKTDYFDY